MLPPRIVEAVPKPESVLLVRFADGAESLFDVKPYLCSDFFQSLGDDAYFWQILAGFVRDGDTVVIDAAPGGEGVTLTTEASPEEAAVTNGHVMAEGGEA